MIILGKLLRAGVDPQLVAEVSDALEAVKQEGANAALAAFRAAAAARQRKHAGKSKRDTDVRNDVSSDVRPDVSSDVMLTLAASRAPARSLCEEVSIKNSTPNGVEQKAKRIRKSSISPDWQLTERDVAYARKCGMTELDIRRERELFINRHTANASLSADWAASWRTWCGNFNKWAKPRAGPSAPREKPMTAAASILQRARENASNERYNPESQSVFIDATALAIGPR